MDRFLCYVAIMAPAFILLGYTSPPGMRFIAHVISPALATSVAILAIHQPPGRLIAVPLLALYMFAFYRHCLRPEEAIIENQCVKCGYDLTGNISGRCPECGTPVSGPPPKVQ